MRPFRVIVALLWLLALVAAHELLGMGATGAVPSLPIAPVSTSSAPRVDLYGNHVFEAVGDYRVDPRGEVYERHAPDTAVLRLGPPGT